MSHVSTWKRRRPCSTKSESKRKLESIDNGPKIWQYREGVGWENFSWADRMLLDSKIGKLETFISKDWSWNGKIQTPYEINFQTMTQKNLDSNRCRGLRCPSFSCLPTDSAVKRVYQKYHEGKKKKWLQSNSLEDFQEKGGDHQFSKFLWEKWEKLEAVDGKALFNLIKKTFRTRKGLEEYERLGGDKASKKYMVDHYKGCCLDQFTSYSPAQKYRGPKSPTPGFHRSSAKHDINNKEPPELKREKRSFEKYDGPREEYPKPFQPAKKIKIDWNKLEALAKFSSEGGCFSGKIKCTQEFFSNFDKELVESSPMSFEDSIRYCWKMKGLPGYDEDELEEVLESVRLEAEKKYSKQHQKLLSKDEVSAINLYTTAFHHDLNKSLRKLDMEHIRPFLPYLRLLKSALNKIPSKKCTVWRSIPGNVELPEKGKEERDCAVISTTDDLESLKSFIDVDCTLFMIESSKAKPITQFSHFPHEQECILWIGTRMEIIGTLSLDQRKIVQAREIVTDQDQKIIFRKNEEVRYKERENVTVIAVHHDEEVYYHLTSLHLMMHYTIKRKDGTEVNTIAKYLQRLYQ
eukprot:jgi/Bigna1/77835/fgenesh1_pg.50_\